MLLVPNKYNQNKQFQSPFRPLGDLNTSNPDSSHNLTFSCHSRINLLCSLLNCLCSCSNLSPSFCSLQRKIIGHNIPNEVSGRLYKMLLAFLSLSTKISCLMHRRRTLDSFTAASYWWLRAILVALSQHTP